MGARARRRLRARIEAGLVLVTTARDACRMNGHRWWYPVREHHAGAPVCVECGERGHYMTRASEFVAPNEIIERRRERKASEVLLHRKDPPRRGPEGFLPGQKPHGTPARWFR